MCSEIFFWWILKYKWKKSYKWLSSPSQRLLSIFIQNWLILTSKFDYKSVKSAKFFCIIIKFYAYIFTINHTWYQISSLNGQKLTLKDHATPLMAPFSTKWCDCRLLLLRSWITLFPLDTALVRKISKCHFFGDIWNSCH